MIDDSLYTGWKNGRPQLSIDSPTSVSRTKEILADPAKWYYTRVLGLEDPPSVALAIGIAGHAGFEKLYVSDSEEATKAFESNLKSSFGSIKNPTVRYNAKNPSFANGKQDYAIDYDGLLNSTKHIFSNLYDKIQDAYHYRILKAQAGSVKVESSLGELARERGMPFIETEIFDPRIGERRVLPVALIGGVPVNGYVDAVAPWYDGSEIIIDHKFVSLAVPYYLTRSGPQCYFLPYDPNNDAQLDVYTAATGIGRAGFQFITKYPQLSPGGCVHHEWVDEQRYLLDQEPDSHLPQATLYLPNGDLHYVSVYRAQPQDHPSAPTLYTPEKVTPRAVKFIREGAEYLTESLILLDSGVDPRYAFPGGDPQNVSRKSCPFCPYQDFCHGQRLDKNADLTYQADIAQRERLCQENKQIMERRKLWTAVTF